MKREAGSWVPWTKHAIFFFFGSGILWFMFLVGVCY